MWNQERLNYSDLRDFFPKNVKGEYFAESTEKCKIIGIYLNKEVENLEDYGCPKVRELADPEADEENRICSSYPFRQKITFYSAKLKTKVLSK